jgi:ABC-2 type transport system ATP-binding protein
LPQSFGYYPSFTALDFVEYAAWLKEVPSGQIRRLAMTALDQVELRTQAHRTLRSLSGGMLRRVGIAQAIVHEPPVVVMDEPSAGLDPAQRIELRELIRRIGQSGTVMISTHLVEDVAAICGEILVLDYGRIVFTGSPEKLEHAGRPDSPGDTALEKGYSTVLANDPQAER